MINSLQQNSSVIRRRKRLQKRIRRDDLSSKRKRKLQEFSLQEKNRTHSLFKQNPFQCRNQILINKARDDKFNMKRQENNSHD